MNYNFLISPRTLKLNVTKIMMNRIFLMIILIYLSNIALAQESEVGFKDPLKTVNTPAPTPCSLGEFGHTSVGYFHGTADINIPLYNLSAGDYSLPISLSYNSSGIKIEEISSWIGLGWSLNAGGCITVNIKGISDLRAGPNNRMKIRTAEDLQAHNYPLTYCETCYDTLYYIAHGLADSEPDIYNYNFCGFSGQFIIDQATNKAKFIKNNQGLSVKINIDNTITARDNLGREYTFNILDSTNTAKRTYAYQYAGGQNILWPWPDQVYPESFYDVTAMWLHSIKLENNQGEIFFDYEKENSYYTTKLHGAITAKNSGTYCEWLGEEEYAFSNEYLIQSSSRLSEIRYLKGDIEIWKLTLLPSTAQREDLKGTYSLSNIELRERGNVIKNWQLFHSYFLSDVSRFEADYINFQQNVLSKRLKLDSIRQYYGSTVLPAYKMIYYGDITSSKPGISLPFRTSFDGYDHWGYCNKAVDLTDATLPSRLLPKFIPYMPSNVQYTQYFCKGATPMSTVSIQTSVLIPPFESFVSPPPQGGPTFIGNHPMGDRNPNLDFTLASTLEKIQYPTGGYSVYQYELNSLAQSSYNNPYSVAGGLRIARITDGDVSDLTIRTFQYGESGGGYLSIKPCYISVFPSKNADGDSEFTSCGCGYPQQYDLHIGGYNLSTSSITSVHSPSIEHVVYPYVIETFGNTKIKYFYNSSIGNAEYKYQVFYVDGLFENTTARTASGYSTGPVFPFTNGYTGPIYKNGTLDKVLYINNTNNIEIVVKKEEYQYEYSDQEKIYGNEVYIEPPSYSVNYGTGRIRWLNAYYYEAGKLYFKTKTTTVFDTQGTNPVTTIENYTYNTAQDLLKSKEDILGYKTIKTTYTYPLDYPDETFEESNGKRTDILDALHYMTDKNMLAYPVETLISIGSGWKDGILCLYKRNINSINPSATYNYNIGTPQMGTKAFNGRIENPTYFHKQNSFDDFDLYGNILQMHKDSNIKISYIWAYNKTYPIAETQNATNAECSYTGFENHETSGWSLYNNQMTEDPLYVKTGKTAAIYTSYPIWKTLSIWSTDNLHSGYKASVWVKGSSNAYIKIMVEGNSSIYRQTNNVGGDTSTWKLIEVELPYSSYSNLYNTDTKLQVQCGSSSIAYFDDIRFYPMDAQMTTYTYDPLIGVTSVSDYNNKPTKYEYDAFGRLVLVRDYLGEILKKYDYNYAH